MSSYKVPRGKRLVKVSDCPPTWLELDKNLTEEQIRLKIEEYNASNETLDDMIKGGYFDSLKKSGDKKYIKTDREEVHIPHYNNLGFY